MNHLLGKDMNVMLKCFYDKKKKWEQNKQE